jgi:DNA-binding XRE family transcriptional regulator
LPLFSFNLSTSPVPEWRCFDIYATTVASIVKGISFYGYCVQLNQMPEYISSEIARLLKEEREKRHISLNLLAQKAGVNRQSVAFIEQGLRNPTLNTLFRLTLALEVEPEDIIGRARKLAAKKHPK